VCLLVTCRLKIQLSMFDMRDVSQQLLTAGCTKYNYILGNHTFVKKTDNFIMATLWNRAGHYIFALWFLLSFNLSSFFPRLFSAVADWMSTILLHMVWP